MGGPISVCRLVIFFQFVTSIGTSALKKLDVKLVCLAILIHLLCPLTADASSSHADSVLVCGVGHEEWRRDHPQPAAKRPANLNVGEPRTVRMIYCLPNDRPLRQEIVDSMKTVIKRVQTFYAEEMQANGHGNKTFRFEGDAQGEPVVHRVDGQHSDSHYTSGGWPVSEIERRFDLDANIYLIVTDYSIDAIPLSGGGFAGGFASPGGKINGYILVPHSVRYFTVAHELGHTFGLGHDFRDNRYIMSYGWDERGVLSACAAEFLAVNPYFNPTKPIQVRQPPAVELTSPIRYPIGVTSVPLRFKVNDSDGVHQVILFANTIDKGVATGSSEVKACRRLAGETDSVVEFEYDGAIPSSPASSLSDPALHRIEALTVDRDGDVRKKEFYLAEIPSHPVTFLEGHSDRVEEVSFSPDGTILASGATDGTIRLWDVATHVTIAALDVGGGVTALSFSPDGTRLASGATDETVRLWDVDTGEQIAILGRHPEYVESLAFSLDGKILASGSGYGDSSIKLWDVNAREQVGTLEGHTSWVFSLSFSPDSTTLASGSIDSKVRLWDVPSRTPIATIEKRSSITSVSFSPDGSVLAYGAFGGMVWLWDVEGKATVGTLDHPGWAVYSLSFSPDGRIIATSSTVGTVWLWDVANRTSIATLSGHAADLVYSVSFSPDGTTLASGTSDNTVILRDVSEWTGPRPFAMEIVSGLDQQRPAGTALAEPFVVVVLDQNGDPVAGATVVFTVTAGGGELSVATVTTDENGRATTTLTLGSQPGANTVVASVADLDPVTYTATGTAASDFDGDGTVGFSDFVQFAGRFGLSQDDDGFDVRFDLDGNGAIGFSDLLIFAGAFGKETP